MLLEAGAEVDAMDKVSYEAWVCVWCLWGVSCHFDRNTAAEAFAVPPRVMCWVACENMSNKNHLHERPLGPDA